MSNRTLDQLIATLKTEAIDTAEKESNKILEEANFQAQTILKVTEEKRKQILLDAENKAKAIINNGTNTLRQAARDFDISVRNDLLKLFRTVFEKEICKEFSPNLIKTAIIRVIENVGSDVELKFPKEFIQELTDFVHKRLQTFDDLVSITEHNSVLAGFSITKTDQGWSYYISPEEITEVLQSYLTSNWLNILKDKDQT